MDSTTAPQYAPPAPPAPPMATGTPAPPRPPKKNRGWLIALVVIGSLVIFGCIGSVFLLASWEGGGGVPLGDSIALIRLDGVIAGTGSTMDGVITPEAFIDQLDQAEADDSVKAILIRADSPGGTVAASQECAMAIQRVEKPVVVSVGDMCASGAYMIASQCDEIIAAPGSSVGSIGVIMEIPNVSGLLDKVGVEFTTLAEGEFKDAGSPYRSVTNTESAMFEEQMKMAYDQFITDVANGRDMDEADVRELATGWVWLGTEAKELGLVDTIGNFSDAVDRAAELGGIEGEPGIVTFEPQYNIEDLALSLFGLISNAQQPDAASLQRMGLPK